ncbi:unnamed protein product [Ceutorhynchus assimilis]|uniref:LysM domain-containing protein n=1 Tax=Ceutorhynchus assimilis TaxID=467358 RepID=A0A9N9MJC9_9CUCU|nr:unnamed protein product [Ceutorhynchus assimilis]
MMKQRQKNKYKHIDKRDKASGSSSDDGEETELFVRNKSPKKEIPTLEKSIEEGDTLQSIAIRYHCTIEDLKRLNNIHKENEIYARRTIKVPHRPFTEALATVHSGSTTSPIEMTEPSTSKLIDIDMLETKLTQQQSVVNQIIFNSNFSNKTSDRMEDSTVLDSNEDVSLLPEYMHLPQSDPIISRLSCNGSDWDISFPALIVCIVLVIFAVPIIYVFYIAEHPEIYLNHTSEWRNGS